MGLQPGPPGVIDCGFQVTWTHLRVPSIYTFHAPQRILNKAEVGTHSLLAIIRGHCHPARNNSPHRQVGVLRELCNHQEC